MQILFRTIAIVIGTLAIRFVCIGEERLDLNPNNMDKWEFIAKKEGDSVGKMLPSGNITGMASSNQTIFLTGQADQTSFRDGR
jgi:hypothetical protein